MHLDAILTDEPLTGGLEPRLGRAHLRVLTIMGFPSATHPGVLDELTIHAGTALGALRRLEQLIQEAVVSRVCCSSGPG